MNDASSPAAGPDGPGLPRLLLGVCGSGNILALPQYLLALRTGPAAAVRVVMTRTAAALMPASTVRLVCEDVYVDGADELDPGHVALAAWADRVVLLPATANMLGQAAHGLASGLLSSTLLAHESPVLFFPSMNLRMWERPAVRRNVALLRADGHVVVEPVPVDAWQLSTRDVRKNLGLPAPATVAAMVGEFCRPPGPRPAPPAG
ncbi:MAG TPA: flavoprotein [Streptomyces sp.]|uniref:flavoprotein n=1 Tax=Streptomyces sp. TaxID=1931 RepID=UPI002CD06AAE|nr:flavoprotein [Streptomyces sp.]HWU10040.1 flavoprotein [Streptomyces sp.]